MKILNAVWKALFRTLQGILLLAASGFLLVLLQYILPARYDFPEARPFTGESWYNPYRGMDTCRPILANYHMHSHAWGGITNGAENMDHQVYDIYTRAGFGSIAISNYQSVNTLYSDSASYVPAYEHGYGFYKNHQLCLGATKVVWFDLPFGQNIHHKQYILNLLRPHNALISINHPSFFSGYEPADFTKLTGYNFIEVLNGFRNSVPHWDSALSAGRPAMILANDDMHDVNNPREIGRRFTVIHAPSNKREDIFAALDAGRAFGVFFKGHEGETLRDKTGRFSRLPGLTRFEVKNDTLFVGLDTAALEFRFIGQGGSLLSKRAHSPSAFYPLQPGDTYVRTEILFTTPHDREGLQYFLNPLLRSQNGDKPPMPRATVNQSATWLYRAGLSLAVCITAVLWVLMIRRLKRKQGA